MRAWGMRSPLGPFDRLASFTEHHVREGSHAQHSVEQRIKRTERKRCVDIDLARSGVAQQGLSPSARILGLSIVGGECVGPVEPWQAAFQITAQDVRAAHGEVSEWVDGIAFKALRGIILSKLCGFSRIATVAKE